MKFGFHDADLAYIISVIEDFTEIKQAIIFGSRAKGNYKAGSDVDIAVLGENISFSTIACLHSRLEEEGSLPYFFDIVDYTHSTHKQLKEHIERVGKTIFVRKTTELLP
jgi:predicted nucleotidyltransferase